jgi:5-methylcytosine-specific restriction endonuclease McrA
MDQRRAVSAAPPPATERIPHDLPRAERLRRILDRDGAHCVWCRRPLAPGHRDLSLEHVVPRLKGGPAWPENEVAACRACNRARGHTAPAAWLEACEGRGLRPDRPAVEASLLRLRGAIAERGGQRRARPYLDGQLRRLRLA